MIQDRTSSTMKKKFATIGLYCKPHDTEAFKVQQALYNWLDQQKYALLVEQNVPLAIDPAQLISLNQLGEQANLVIVIGGDGHMLGAARVLSRYDVAVIGINRGHLGFLTDILPDDFITPLQQVLAGEYVLEKRFLLDNEVHRHGQVKSHNAAMNEAVLHAGKVAHMFEFEVFIDDKLMYSQRADGLIVATPTGSTAYALSAGGTIASPDLDILMLLPMFPHTLAARPIAISADRVIRINSAPIEHQEQRLSCDGQVQLPVLPGDTVMIKRSRHQLQLVHPPSYDYFNVLHSKLNWGSKLY
jgi:NAD+ kinase